MGLNGPHCTPATHLDALTLQVTSPRLPCARSTVVAARAQPLLLPLSGSSPASSKNAVPLPAARAQLATFARRPNRRVAPPAAVGPVRAELQQLDAREVSQGVVRGYDTLTVGIVAETAPGEKRVALAPESVAKLVKNGLSVVVESGAGEAAEFADSAYESAGATIVDGSVAWGADIVCKIRPPTIGTETGRLSKDQILFSNVYPRQNEELVEVCPRRRPNRMLQLRRTRCLFACVAACWSFSVYLARPCRREPAVLLYLCRVRRRVPADARSVAE